MVYAGFMVNTNAASLQPGCRGQLRYGCGMHRLRATLTGSRALFALLLGMLLLSGDQALAGLTRHEILADDGRLAVAIRWAFSEPFDACLMLTERLPTGWTFDEADSEDTDVHARIETDRFSLAVGVFQPLPLEGALTYWLAPANPDDPDTLLFEGQGRSMRGIQRLAMPLGGEHTFAWSPALPPPGGTTAQLALRVTGFRLTSPDAGQDTGDTISLGQTQAESDMHMGFAI